MGAVEEGKNGPAAAVEEVSKATSEEDGTWFWVEEDDGLAATFGTLNVDWTLEMVGLLAPSLGDGVDENDGALVEDCRSFGGFPTRLNNLDKVSAGCTTAEPWFSVFILPT